jgi:hypothetical protein
MRRVVVLCLLIGCKGQAASTTPDATPVAYDSSCQHDWECTPAPTCCPIPCNEDVVNVKDSARASANLNCDPARQCMSAGGCRTFQYLCLEHRCKLAFAGDADYRERETEPPFSRAQK